MAKPTTNFIDKHVGMRVRRVRMFREMSQPQLAYDLSISLHQLQKYEGGFQRIDAAKLLEICKVFEVRPAFFFDDVRVNGPLIETSVGEERRVQGVASLEKRAKTSIRENIFSRDVKTALIKLRADLPDGGI